MSAVFFSALSLPTLGQAFGLRISTGDPMTLPVSTPQRRLALARRAGLALALLLATAAAQAALPIQHWTQPSGARVALVESPAIPMLDVQIDFDAGSRRDPARQAGLASVSALMSARGVQAHGTAPALDENALSEAWADLGASFGGSASSDRLTFGLRTLTEPDLLDRAVALAARQLAEPALPEAVWRRERERLVASLKEEDTRPGTQAGKAFARAVYGDHPYGYEMSAATLATIQVSDLRSYLKRSVRACDARVSLVGAVSREQADALVTRLLALLPAGPCQPQAAVPEVAPLTQAETLGLPFDSAQAHLFIGQPGIRRADPDYFAPGVHAGAFTIGLQTRPDQAAEAVKVAREVLSRYVADGPTEAELKAAKDNLVGGFALRIDSNKKLLDNVANMALHGLPWDYLDTWTQQVEKVSVQDIRAAFQRHLQPDRLVTVTVGARP